MEFIENKQSDEIWMDHNHHTIEIDIINETGRSNGVVNLFYVSL